MVLSRNFEDINSIYDFCEGIITNICWNENLTDLLLTVYYFFDSPIGLKDKDIRIRFKNCSAVTFNCTNMLAAMKQYGIATPHPEIDHIVSQKFESCIRVIVSTNYDPSMVSLLCDEIWLELIDK